MKYIYSAIVVKVVDGDTLDAIIDLGFDLSYKSRFRLFGIDTWETRGADKEKGLAAKAFLQQLLLGKTVQLETIKDKKGKYGRYLCTIVINGVNINELLRTAGHEKEKQ